MNQHCHSRRSFTLGLAGLAGLGSLPLDLRAQGSDTPLRIIVPFGAGGTSDFLGRAISPALGDELRRPVIVENRPGVNGVVGLNAVAKAPADGNTFVLTDVGALTTTPHMVQKMPLNIFEELVPVAVVATLPYIFVVNPQLPIKNLEELKAYSLSKPNGFNFATVGAGTAQHLIGIELAKKLGVQWTYVPYKGGAPALVDIMGGSADGIVLSSPPLMPLIAGNKIRPIAISANARWDRLPEVATFAEQGLKGYLPQGAQCILAPKGTPAAKIQALNDAVRTVVAQPAIKARFLEQGAYGSTISPAETGAMLKAEYARAGVIIKDNGIKREE